MFTKKKTEVRVFTLPNEEELLNQLLNNDMVDIIEEMKSISPKEGVILYLVKYEKYE
ncbi:MAG: hypothetical protein ACRCX2_05925 [Paraclostridium sp.]